MTDNLQNRGPQDRERINTSEEWEVDYWSNKFEVCTDQLRGAVKAVGPMVADVRRKLGK